LADTKNDCTAVGVSVQAIQQHIATLITHNEIEQATIKKYLIVQQEGIREVKLQS